MPLRCRATHKDLPDPPKKSKPPKLDRDIAKGDVDPVELKRLAESINPRERETLRQVDDPLYKQQLPQHDLPTQPKTLFRLLWEHIVSSKDAKGPQPLSPTLDWQAERKPFDRPLSFGTILSILLLLVVWLVYTRDYESDIAAMLAELAGNPPLERQLELLEKLYYCTLGLSQQLRRMQAPQSESLEESGIIAAFVRAIAGNDARSSELGYAGLSAFLSLSPEAVPVPRLGKVAKPMFAAILRDVTREANLQRDIDLNLWRTFLAFSHQYEFARMVPTEVLVYIATRIATLADSAALSPVEREHFSLLRKLVIPLSSNERADRFFKSQASDTFQQEYEKLKHELPFPIAVQAVDMRYPFVEEVAVALFGATMWAGLRASRVAVQANTIGIRPMWRLSRPHFSSLVNSALWSGAGVTLFLFARTEATQWPDKVVSRVRAKIAGRELAEGGETKRINQVLAPYRLATGAATAAVVANMPHAAGVVLGLSIYDVIKSKRSLQLLEKHTLRNELFLQLEKVKGEVKNWAIEKVYGSGPRY